MMLQSEAMAVKTDTIQRPSHFTPNIDKGKVNFSSNFKNRVPTIKSIWLETKRFKGASVSGAVAIKVGRVYGT